MRVYRDRARCHFSCRIATETSITARRCGEHCLCARVSVDLSYAQDFGHYDYDRLEYFVTFANGVHVLPELASLTCTADFEDTQERFGDPVASLPLPQGPVPLYAVDDGEDERLDEKIREFRHQFLSSNSVTEPEVAAAAKAHHGAIRAEATAVEERRLAALAVVTANGTWEKAVDVQSKANEQRMAGAAGAAAAAAADEAQIQAKTALDLANHRRITADVAAKEAADQRAACRAALTEAEAKAQARRARQDFILPIDFKVQQSKLLTKAEIRLANLQGLLAPVLPVQDHDEAQLFVQLLDKHTCVWRARMRMRMCSVRAYR